ncbi:MAG: hypothetical protein ABI885_27745, partial [Gammaproteobacteria bacterium]
MEIRKRTLELHGKLSRLTQAQATYAESRDLDEFRVRQLEPRVARLRNVTTTLAVFAERGIIHEAIAAPSSLQAKIGALRSQFQQSPVRATVVAPGGWPTAQPSLDS